MPSLLDNFGHLIRSARTGFVSFVQAYRQDYFVAGKEFHWDDYMARVSRYYHNQRLVDNTLYSAVNRTAVVYKNTEQLYKFIRGLRNPVSRLVNAEVDKVFGGFVNLETFEDGAIQIKGADKTLLEALRTIYQWTDISAFKNLLVRQGSSMGDVFILVVDDVAREKVYMEVLDADKVIDARFDARGNVTEIFICYERDDYGTRQKYDFGLHITKEMYRTFRNDKLYAYSEAEGGTGLSEWPNPYGFIPVRLTRHVDNGQLFGETSFHNARTKIDNLNDSVSLLHNNIRRIVETKYAVTGEATIPKDSSGNPISINVSTDTRDSSPLLQLKGGDIKAIVFPLDILGTLKAIESQTQEIEADLPILALQQIRNLGGNMSGIAIENLYGDGLGAVATLQGNYYNSMIAASQMAISIASFRRYDGFRAYNLNSYENGSLDFTIRPKPVIQYTIPTDKNIELTMQAAESDAWTLVAPKLGYSKEEIEMIEEMKAAKTRQATRQSLREQAVNLRANAASQRLQDNGSNRQAQDVQALEIDVNNSPDL
jgi:hypothetical protein